MATRQVTIRLSSCCGTPFIHQPVYLQLSSGEVWIPLDGPIRVPPRGDKSPSPKVSVADIAAALGKAVVAAQVAGGAKVGNVTPVTRGPWVDEDGNQHGSAEVFEFSFATEDDEIDFSVSGVEFDASGHEYSGGTQLKLAVLVGAGDNEFEVKPVPMVRLVETGASGKPWRKPPGGIVPKRKRIRVRRGEGGRFGDPPLFPPPDIRPRAWQDEGEQRAYWEPGESDWQWAARMAGSPRPVGPPLSPRTTVSREADSSELGGTLPGPRDIRDKPRSE
jgi:hypothetical protein